MILDIVVRGVAKGKLRECGTLPIFILLTCLWDTNSTSRRCITDKAKEKSSLSTNLVQATCNV